MNDVGSEISSPVVLLEGALDCLRAGQAEQAETMLKQLIRLDPTSFDAHLALGHASMSLKQWHQAEDSYSQASFLKPNSYRAHLGHGMALRNSQRTSDALAALQRALKLRGDSATCLGEMALTYLDLGEVELAQEAVTRALKLQPNSARLYDASARALLTQGEFAQATEHLRRALSLDPDYSPALLKLAKLGGLSSESSESGLMRLLKSRSIPLPDKRNLAFALGVGLDREGRYSEAFDAFETGNAAQLQIVSQAVGSYRAEQRDAEVDKLIRTYSVESVARWSGKGQVSGAPIFVLGMPRSGTTLVEQILASHPKVHGAGELRQLGHARVGFEALIERCGGGTVATLPRVLIQRIATEYLRSSFQTGCGKLYFVDKNPHNFENLGLILVLFPNAHIIHCWREPADTCLSNYFQIFSLSHCYNNRLEDLGHYFGQYVRLMQHWYKVAGDKIYRIHYEDLVDDPERQIRSLLNHCHLGWRPACMDFHATRRPVSTPSQVQVRQPLYRSSVGRWKHYRPHIEPLLKQLPRVPPEQLFGR